MGDHVTVTGGVQFVTHDGGVWIFREEAPDLDVFGPIRVGSNVFIGYGSLILPNVVIGSNVVVGAGSVVTSPIPDNVVAAGVPARVIKSTSVYRSQVFEQALFVRGLTKPEKKMRVLAHFRSRAG